MISHNAPTLGLEEQAAAARVIASGWVAQGSEVASFEDEICNFFNLPKGHAVAVSSGSAALYLALWILEAKDKRVGLPVYACAALRNAVGLAEGKPLYLDCSDDGPNIDIFTANQKNLDFLIAPSMFGIPVDLSACRGFKIIEDIAQSFGATEFGEPVGLRGDIGICSFYATKMITSGGQGGALISRNKLLIDELKNYREFDSRQDTKLRFNFQMTDLQAAIGRVQLKKLPKYINLREKLFDIYRSEGLNLMDGVPEKNMPVRYRAVVHCDEPTRLIKFLAKEGVSAIIPIQDWELLDGGLAYPRALKLATHTISLPIYPSLLEKDARRIAKLTRSFI